MTDILFDKDRSEVICKTLSRANTDTSEVSGTDNSILNSLRSEVIISGANSWVNNDKSEVGGMTDIWVKK